MTRSTRLAVLTGLDGTGDSASVQSTVQSVAAMLSRSGVKVDPDRLRTRNVAAVMIKAVLPPFAAPGSTLDVVVSSLGDAKSLRGGSLMIAPLRAVNGEVYAVASGELIVGGFAASGSGTTVTKNHPTVGRIPGGGIVERAVEVELGADNRIVWLLNQADFTTANRLAAVIAKEGLGATALDSHRVRVVLSESQRANLIPLIARIEALTLESDAIAKVVINPRTGTVVMGANVRLSPVALAHGGLEVSVASRNEVVQPGAFAGGTTAGIRNAEVKATEAGGALHLVKGSANLGELVAALNALGVKPSDLIDILQAIRSAGALNAELEVL